MAENQSDNAENNDEISDAVKDALAHKEGWVIHVTSAGHVYMATGDHASKLLDPLSDMPLLLPV